MYFSSFIIPSMYAWPGKIEFCRSTCGDCNCSEMIESRIDANTNSHAENKRIQRTESKLYVFRVH